MISQSEALILAGPGVLLPCCHMRGSSLIWNSWAGSTPACRRDNILSCTQATFLGHCRNGLDSLYISLVKIKSDATFEECRGHILCISIHMHVISKDAEKAIKKLSDHSRNRLCLKGREYLLYTYSSGGQYATQSLETQDIPLPWFDAALGDFLSHFTFSWFLFLCSALTMPAP